jgi:thioredoxin reductase (NADPH)
MTSPSRRILITGMVSLFALGAENPASTPVEQVVIIGGGPAGYTAALYAARAGLKPLVLEGPLPGGQPNYSPEVENYPGYPDGVSGPRMMADFRRQGERFGARFLAQKADGFQPGSAGSPHRVVTGGGTIEARAVILAMGAQFRRLEVPGETALTGQGVAYCASCDASLFRGKETVVVGGDDSALGEALFLARFASKVTLVHSGTTSHASRILLDRAKAASNIQWRVPCTVQAFLAGDQGRLARVMVSHDETGRIESLPAQGAFVAIGQVPQSGLVRTCLDLDEIGYVLTDGSSTRTGIPGVFACGELVDRTYRQSVTAAGSGCRAALDAERYLRDAPSPISAPHSIP